MADHYFFSRDDTPFGPFSATEMRGLAAGGRIRPTDPVWKEGTGQSVLAARVKNLFAVSQPLQDPLPALEARPGPQTATPALGGASLDRGAEGEPAAVLAEVTAEAAAPLPEPPTRVTDEQASGRQAPPTARRGPEAPARPKRVVAIKGATLTGQDGVRAQFRKKCGTCGHEDGCRSTAIIRIGCSRVLFFCPRCRRSRTVELTAIG